MQITIIDREREREREREIEREAYMNNAYAYFPTQVPFHISYKWPT